MTSGQVDRKPEAPECPVRAPLGKTAVSPYFFSYPVVSLFGSRCTRERRKGVSPTRGRLRPLPPVATDDGRWDGGGRLSCTVAPGPVAEAGNAKPAPQQSSSPAPTCTS